METEGAALELIAAMAEVRRRLSAREVELRREHEGVSHTSSSVSATNQLRKNAPDFLKTDPRAYFGPGIEVFLSMRLEDDSWVEWFAWAINRLDGNGWTIEREVSLDVPDGRPEVNRVASSELDEVIVSDSGTLARRLPSLIDEMVALPVPEQPPV
jgi:hypothetical protein